MASDSEDDFDTLLQSVHDHVHLGGASEDEGTPEGGPAQEEANHSPSTAPGDMPEGSASPLQPRGVRPNTTPMTPTRGLLDGAVRELANRLKRQKKIQPIAESELDIFIETPGGVRPVDVLLKYDNLVLRETLHNIHQLVQQSNINIESLKPNIAKYVKAALLAHTLALYRGNIAEVIFACMRELGIPGLPSESDAAQVAQLLSIIGVTLTRIRCEIKAMIIESRLPTSDNRNLAKLAEALVGSSGLHITLPMLQRVAMIRKHAAPKKDDAQKKVSDDDWWLALDERLEKTRKSGAAVAQAFFESVYKKDTEAFGDPLDVDVTITRLDDIGVIQKTVNRLVLGVKAASKKKRAAKRPARAAGIADAASTG